MRLSRPAVTLRANVEKLFDRDDWASTNDGQLLLASPRTVSLSASIDY